MEWMRIAVKRLAGLFGGRRRDAELDAEVREHIALATEEKRRQGLNDAEARTAALREFGGVTQIKEQYRVRRGVPFLEQMARDVRYAARQMMRAPGFTVAVVATLALGIGAATAIFTLVYATLLGSLPYPEANRIVRINDVRLQGQSTGGLMGAARFFDIGARSRSFTAMGLFYFDHPTMIAGTEMPVALQAAGANAGFWQVFGGRALVGRTFDARDDARNAAPVAVLSYAAWQKYFAGDAGVVGRTVTLDGKSTTIVGVMPQSFNVPNAIEMWRPAQFDPGQWTKYRGDGSRFINVYARLAPGATLASARSDLKRIGEQLRTQYAGTDGMWQFEAMGLRDDMYGAVRPALVILQIASGFLLLVACLNVANLMLSRATARGREVALRRALGASEGRIRMQLLTESALLALGGGGAGVALAAGLVHALATKLPGRLGAPGTIAMNWPVAGFAAAVTVAAGVVFGLAPAVHRRGAALSASLKAGEQRLAGSAGAGVRSAFIAVQVGLSMVLLVGAALLGESLWNLMKQPLGFAPDHLLTFRIGLPWNAKQDAVRNFYTEVQRRIEALPGVEAAGEISALPTEDWHLRSNFDADWLPRVADHPAINAEDRNIAGDYLKAMGIPVVLGRGMTEEDSNATPVRVLVNQEFAREYMPGGNPVGRHLIQGKDTAEIVGVIGDVRGTAGSLAKAVGPEVYWPADGDGGVVQRSFVVRTRVEPEALTEAIREQVRAVDAQQAITRVSTMDDLLDKAVAQPRLNMALVAAFAALALLLACVGIYGVVAWSAAQRVQEIGVRMALGATRTQIAVLFMRRAMTAAVVGLAVGTGAALGLTRLVRSELYGIAPNDPAVYAAAAALLLLPVALATLRPALRAAGVNPVEALRTE
jgi:predicted permease